MLDSPRISILSGSHLYANNSMGNFPTDNRLPPSDTASLADDQIALLTETNSRLKKKLMDMVKALDQTQKMTGGSNLGSVNNDK